MQYKWLLMGNLIMKTFYRKCQNKFRHWSMPLTTEKQQQDIHQQGVTLCPSHRGNQPWHPLYAIPMAIWDLRLIILSQHNVMQPHKVTTPPGPHMRAVRTVLLTFIFHLPVGTQKAAGVSSHGTTP